jgi:hypothetical protein
VNGGAAHADRLEGRCLLQRNLTPAPQFQQRQERNRLLDS